ncbi:MAG: ethanolamine utilization protein EutH [Eggerthellaceae bacterium]|nr:ethanolamine utilization protein EutH [Eggerthellaceae bacterium]
MELIGTIVVYIMMACMAAGAIASMVKPESELGNQFIEGLYSIGPIFLSVGGIFASIPYITWFVETVFGPAFGLVGADPALASTTIVATDMGGYQTADAIAATRESWIMAMFTGFMAGATIVYSLPIGLRMVDKKDHKYLALGMMCGFVSIPFGVLVGSAVIMLSNPMIRETISNNAEATYQMALTAGEMLPNLVPITIICVLIALGLKFIPNGMIKGFTIFGRFIDYAARAVLMLSIIEYFTGCFSTIFGGWGFEPLAAYGVLDPETGTYTDAYISQSVEVVASIGMMLAGAFPMVYLIKTYLAKPLGKIGTFFGLSDLAVSGILATSANALALFPMVKDMEPLDKVKVLAYCVCGSFIIGDHLSFCATYQPTLIAPLMIGKFVAAILAIVFVRWLAKKKTLELAAIDAEAEAAEAKAAMLEADSSAAIYRAEAAAIAAAKAGESSEE